MPEIRLRLLERECRQFGCREAWNASVQHARAGVETFHIVAADNFTMAQHAIPSIHLKSTHSRTAKPIDSYKGRFDSTVSGPLIKIQGNTVSPQWDPMQLQMYFATFPGQK